MRNLKDPLDLIRGLPVTFRDPTASKVVRVNAPVYPPRYASCSGCGLLIHVPRGTLLDPNEKHWCEACEEWRKERDR